jgi:SRSO17 transposase
VVAELGDKQLVDVTFRDGPDGTTVTSRFAFMRVWAGNRFGGRVPWPPTQEWLIAEWPEGAAQPTDYWISNLPADTPPERLARLARLRWKIELDYKQLKGELGLDHYEGRSWLGWYHHTALVTAAHGFLTLERQHPNPRRPA